MVSVLSFSQLSLVDGAMEITLTLTVKNDFSWNVHYRRTLVSHDHCTLIKEITYPLQSGKFHIDHV